MKHLLVVNIFFSPRSFGGATVVTEELTRRIAASGRWRVSVLSFSSYGATAEPAVIRTRLPGGIDHYTVNFGAIQTPDMSFDNPEIAKLMRKLIADIAPDAAHVHCLQELGAGVIDALAEIGAPVLLSTHDYWWLCEKVFMLNATGFYCKQERINRKICARCVVDASTLDQRWEKSLATMRKAAAITYPSRYARMIHELNGVPAEKGLVLSNGVATPKPGGAARRGAKRLRFGYIGGPGPLKGWPMIERAFKSLDPEKVELVLVDAATHVGKSWWGEYRFGPIEPHVTITPGYTMETIDEFFAGIDVLLFLSTWKETFGLTSREAALRGVHVLATDCGAPIEPLIDGDTMTLIPGLGSARSLRKALHRLVDHGVPQATEAGRAKIAAEIHSYERQTEEVLALLEQISASGS